MSEDLRNDPLLEGLDKEGAYALLPGLRLEAFAEPWELGKLYHARRTDGEGRCFVYVVDPSLVREPQTVLPRLVWHVQSLAGLSDTRCLAVEGFHTRGELQYAVCDHFESQTLERMVKERGPLSWETAREDLITAAAAVSVVRAKGIGFVGVDPSLLRVGSGGSLRLVPFGGASAGHPPSLEFAPYRPPEFWSESEEPGPAADVWALATTFCFAATGVTPYAGAEVAEIRQQILSGELPLPLRDLATPPPGSLLAVLRTCLALDPAERPADTDRLRELLSPSGEIDLRETLDQFPEFGMGEHESDDLGPMTEELIPPALREFTVGSEESSSEPEPDAEPEPESESEPAPESAPPSAEPKATPEPPPPPPPAQPKQESSSESVLDINASEIGLRPLDSTGRFLVNVPVTPIPELPPEPSREPSTPVSKRKRAPKTAESTGRKRRLWPVVLLLLVIGLGAAGYQFRDRITELLDRGESAPEQPPVDPLIAKLDAARSAAESARDRWNQGRDADWPDPEQAADATAQMEKADAAGRTGQRAQAIEAFDSAAALFGTALVAQEQSRELARTAADKQRQAAALAKQAGEDFPDNAALLASTAWVTAEQKLAEAEDHWSAGRFLDAEVAFVAATQALETSVKEAKAQRESRETGTVELVARARLKWEELAKLLATQDPDLLAAYVGAGLSEEKATQSRARIDGWATSIDAGELEAVESDATAAAEEFALLQTRCETASECLARINQVETDAQTYDIPEALRQPLIAATVAAARELLANADYEGIEALLARVAAAPGLIEEQAAAEAARSAAIESLKVEPEVMTRFDSWVAATGSFASAEQSLLAGDGEAASASFTKAVEGFRAGAEAARKLRENSLASARTLRLEGKPAEAHRALTGALEVFPDDASLKYEFAMSEGAILWAGGEHARAAVATLAAIQLRPADPEANGLFLGALKDLCRQKEGDAAVEATALGLLRRRAEIEPGYEPAATFASELEIRRADRERAASKPEPEPELDANTLVVSGSIAGAYRSVAEALEAAGPGMRILIRAGKYELEDALELRDGVRIVGEARDKVLLHGRGSSGNLLKADEVKDAKVSSVTFAGDGGGSRALVILVESTIQIEDCTFLNPGDECVTISKSGAPRFLRCNFADFEAEGVVVDGKGCNPLFKECKLERRRGELNAKEREDAFDDKTALGFVFRGDANGQVVDTTCRGHRVGVFVEDEGTRARLLRVTVVDCLVGIELRDATAEVSDCRITRCPDCGIRVAEDGATPVLRGNECTGSKIGIHFLDKASGRAESNICRDALSGILIEDKAKPALNGNTCTANRYGLHYIEGGGTARDNLCEKNRDAGILIDDDSSPAVQDNKCNANLKDGIVVQAKSEPELIANTCDSNQAAGIRFGLKGYGKALRNICTQNGNHGIVIGEDSEAIVRGNTCSVHAGFGILMDESDKDAVVEDNVCESNRTGIRCQNKARGTVRNNTCRNNRDYGLHIEDRSRIEYEPGAGGNGIADVRDEND